MNPLKIVKLIPHDNFTMDIFLDNGKSFVFDITPYLSGNGLKKLRQIAFFKQAKFSGERVYWDHDHDFPLHCMDVPTIAKAA
jgi:hypothetical protein